VPESPPNTLSYASPVSRPNYGQAFVRLLLVIVACGAIFAVLGGVVGLVIGVTVPEYYYAVFRNDSLNAPAIGCVMGVGQGGALGVVAGLVLALILTWREVRLSR
jgi:hypothetical protein